MDGQEWLEHQLDRLIKELRKHSEASVSCSDMADALYNIVDGCDMQDVISDLALDDTLPGV